MSTKRQFWTSEVMPDGVHKVILEPRPGFVLWLHIFAVISLLLFAFGAYGVFTGVPLSMSVVLYLLFFLLFGGVSFVGALHETRRQNVLYLSANQLIFETSFFHFKYKRRKGYKNAILKIYFYDSGDGQTAYLSMFHDAGLKVVYVADYTTDLDATVCDLCRFGEYVSRITGWTLEHPKNQLIIF